MEIGNVTQFVNFIQAHSFTSLDTLFLQTANCLGTYSTACNCYKVADKHKQYSMCVKLYLDCVRHAVPKHKNVILAKVPEGRITFRTDNGGLIAIVSR
jgi:hypothetical protein